MLLDLRGRRGGRDRRLFTYQATVLIPFVLMTTVSCSTLPADLAECDLFSGLVAESPRQQVAQQEEVRPKARREQPSTSTRSKVAAVRAPKATSRPVSGGASKKANTPQGLDAQEDLFQEFLDWQRHRTGLP